MPRIASLVLLLSLTACANPYQQLADSLNQQDDVCQSRTGDAAYYCYNDLAQRRAISAQVGMTYLGTLSQYGRALHVTPPQTETVLPAQRPIPPPPPLRGPVYCYGAGMALVCQ